MPSVSRFIMAALRQSVTSAALEGGTEGVVQVRSQGLGVSSAALDVFSNFVHHIATNAEPTSAATLLMQPNKPLPRRSKRFEPRVEAPNPCPQTMPTPPQTQVRLPGSLPCGDGSQLGFRERRRS